MSLKDYAPGMSPVRAWHLTFVLFLAYVVGQIDRQVLVMLAGEMKRALLFSDEQLGLLMGLAFSLPYALGAFLFASLAPRIGRKRTLMGAVFIWSVLTMSCTVLTSFPALALVRVVIGLCEGCLAPTALPMVTAAFPPDRRSMPLALCASGTSIGSLVAPITTGFIISAMAGHQFGPFPLVGIVHGWQTAFLIAGSIGLIVVALMLTTAEPQRGNSGDGAQDTAAERTPRHFRRYWKFYFAILVAVPLSGAPGLAVLIWLPAFLERSFGLEPKDVGTMITIVTIPATLVGPFLGGFVGKFTTRLGHTRRFEIVLALIMICSGLYALPFLMPTALTCVIAFGVMLMVMTVHVLLGIINCQQLVPAAYRGQAAATFLSVQIAGGVGLGSFVVGLLATRVVGEGALHLAVLLLIPLSLMIALLSLLTVRRDKAVPELDGQ